MSQDIIDGNGNISSNNLDEGKKPEEKNTFLLIFRLFWFYSISFFFFYEILTEVTYSNKLRHPLFSMLRLVSDQ